MIKGFNCVDTQTLFETGKCKRFSGIANVAMRKLAQLDAAQTLGFLRGPPGNRLEALQGSRTGQHSIRVNNRFACVFGGRRLAQKVSRSWIITNGER